MRLDQYLFDSGFARSRSHAQDLVKQGLVKVDGKTITKPSFLVTDGRKGGVIVEDSLLAQSVSRGAVKLNDALLKAGIDPSEKSCLDIGVSTGGFSQVLLNRGAKKVLGIDVGVGQLNMVIGDNSRFEGLEGTNVLDWNSTDTFDLIVIDVSFVSLTKVIPRLTNWLHQSGEVLALVKPQFEVGRQNLTKSGLVRDPNLYQDVEDRIKESANQSGFELVQYFESSIEGGDGNKEFFIHIKPHRST